MKKEFDQLKYIKKYNQAHYKQFKVDMKEGERDELLKLIKSNGFKSNRAFLLKCIDILKEDNNCLRKKETSMKFIKGKYEKILRNHENVRDYNYEIGDYFLQYEDGFLVSLNQIIFNEDWKDEDLKDISIREYTEIKEIAKFNIEKAKSLTCNEMKRYIENN